MRSVILEGVVRDVPGHTDFGEESALQFQSGVCVSHGVTQTKMAAGSPLVRKHLGAVNFEFFVRLTCRHGGGGAIKRYCSHPAGGREVFWLCISVPEPEAEAKGTGAQF